mgnify:CR=1 FL=1
MKAFIGKNLKLAGYQVTKNNNGELTETFAVFAKKDVDVENLPELSMCDLLQGKDQPYFSVYSANLINLILAATIEDMSHAGYKGQVKEFENVMNNFSKEELQEILMNITKLDVSKVQTPNGADISIYLPVTGAKPQVKLK